MNWEDQRAVRDLHDIGIGFERDYGSRFRPPCEKSSGLGVYLLIVGVIGAALFMWYVNTHEPTCRVVNGCEVAK